MQECGFIDENYQIPLGDEIIICQNPCNDEFIVANSIKLKAQVYAPEINFYLKNSLDSALEKAKSISALYEARIIGFDESKQSEREKIIENKILIVANDDISALKELLIQNDFKVISLKNDEIKALYGEVGSLIALIEQNGDEYELECDFALIKNARKDMLIQSGSLEIEALNNDEILSFLRKNYPKYHYKINLIYDESICQYHQRREQICSACANVCPSVAILKNDEQKELVFNQIDCIDCGLCVGVCPSGALSLANMPTSALSGIARLYKDKIILLLNEILIDENFSAKFRPFWQELGKIEPFNAKSSYGLKKEPLGDNLTDIALKSGVLPLALNTGALDYVHYLILAQNSGAQIVLYEPNISQISLSNIKIINEIYQKIFGEDAVLIATNKRELEQNLNKAHKIKDSMLLVDDYDMPKREIFASRLAKIIKNNDFGQINSDEIVRYASISIDENICTLCSACVGACNVNALIADSSDNSIKFNASLCTACGYCIASCAESGAIAIDRGKIALNPSFFNYKILAKDELFKCAECGKEFATKKAVEKIIGLMSAQFSGDEFKLKSLRCCADCKAKLMLQAQINASKDGNFYE